MSKPCRFSGCSLASCIISSLAELARRAEVLDPLFVQHFQKIYEYPRGRVSVVAGPVVVDQVHRVIIRDRLELVVLDVWEQPPRKLHGAQRGVPDSRVLVHHRDLVVQEPEIEWRIVGDEH